MGFFSGLFGGGGTTVTTAATNKVTVNTDIDLQNILDLSALEPTFEGIKQTGDRTAEYLKSLTNIQKADVLARIGEATAKMQQTEFIRKAAIGAAALFAFYHFVWKE